MAIHVYILRCDLEYFVICILVVSIISSGLARVTWLDSLRSPTINRSEL